MIASQTVDSALAAIDQDPSKVLGVTINGKSISKGQYVPRADGQNPPEITYSAADPSATYIVVALDLDAPFVSWSTLSPILHWLQPGFKAGHGGLLTLPESPVADWVAVAPPPGAAAHRYTFYLFEQPSDFDISKYAGAGGKSKGIWSRIRFSLDDFRREAKIGEPLAANYFTSN